MAFSHTSCSDSCWICSRKVRTICKHKVDFFLINANAGYLPKKSLRPIMPTVIRTNPYQRRLKTESWREPHMFADAHFVHQLRPYNLQHIRVNSFSRSYFIYYLRLHPTYRFNAREINSHLSCAIKILIKSHQSYVSVCACAKTLRHNSGGCALTVIGHTTVRRPALSIFIKFEHSYGIRAANGSTNKILIFATSFETSISGHGTDMVSPISIFDRLHSTINLSLLLLRIIRKKMYSQQRSEEQ